MRTPRAVLATIAFASLIGIPPASAQEHPNQARGIQPQNAFSTGGIDTVNGMNGGLSLSIPLGQSYPMNGGWSYSFGLSYSSNFWKYNSRPQTPGCGGGSSIEALIDKSFNAGAGWTFSLGRLFSPTDTAFNESGRWIYVDASGGRHTFYPTLHDGETSSPASGCSPTLGCNYQYTRDNSFLRLNRLTRVVEFPNGMTHTFGANSILSRMEDRFQNWVTVDSTTVSTVWRVDDSLGRRHIATFEDKQGGRGLQLISLALEAFGNNTATYNLIYDADATTMISRTDKDTYCGNNAGGTASGADPVNAALLKKVTGPEGLAWTVQKSGGAADYFRPSPSGYPRSIYSGVINSLLFPTGGKLSWTWRIWTFPAGKNSFRDTSAGVATKAVYDEYETGNSSGTWTYSSELCPKVGTEPGTPNCNVTGAPRSNEVISVINSPDQTKFIRYFTANTDDGTLNGTAGGENANWDYGLPFSCREEVDGAGSRKCISAAINGSRAGRMRSYWLHFTRDKKPTYSGDPGPGTLWNLNRRVDYSRQKFDDDGSRYTEETLSSFDGLGHFRVRTEYAAFTTSNWRETTTKYDKVSGCYDINLVNENQTCNNSNTFVMPGTSSKWILDRFAFTAVNEGGIIEKREYSFDPTDGFLDCYRILAGPPLNGWERSGNDVFVDLVRSTGARGYPASEKWYGGDGAALSTGAGCGVTGTQAYEVSHTYSGGVLDSTQHVGAGISHFDQQATIDVKTGLPSTVLDPSGFRTNLS